MPMQMSVPNSWMTSWSMYLTIPSGGQVGLNDFSNPGEKHGGDHVVQLNLHLLTCKSGIPLCFIENLATTTNFAIVDRRHSREHTIDPQRGPQGELADRFRLGICRKLQE